MARIHAFRTLLFAVPLLGIQIFPSYRDTNLLPLVIYSNHRPYANNCSTNSSSSLSLVIFFTALNLQLLSVVIIHNTETHTQREREREMKILCDVCGADEAAVLCCADEAALCYRCDVRIHRANKLAGKHPRFYLLSSSAQAHPVCDICQERRGIVFCKEDRAILCYECDSSIHAANGFTMKHSRFILTGTRLSSASNTTSSPSSEQKISKKKASEPCSAPIAEGSSSISEYLIKMLPGYRVEDFLLDDSITYTAGDVFYQCDALAPVVEADHHSGSIGETTAADWNFSVPDAPLRIHQATSTISAAASATGVFNTVNGSLNKEKSGAHRFLASPAAAPVATHDREVWATGEMFAVPQLPSMPGSNKRPYRP